MHFFRELTSIERERCVIAKYYIETYTEFGSLRDAAWSLAIGQSVGNPRVRNQWETDELFETSSCVIYEDEKSLMNKNKGIIEIGFPHINTDWENDGISHLLCQLMGGQVDINVFKKCRLLDIRFPERIEKYFLGPKYGITGIRNFLKQNNKPISGAIIKPKTGINAHVLTEMVKELLDGGVDFIKEDEILSNPTFCRLEDRVNPVMKAIQAHNRPVMYCFCINGDPHTVLDRARFVADQGGNGVHVNFWSGLGIYRSIRMLDLPLFLHFQKSGDKILTDPRHSFGIEWSVLCDLAGMSGVDTIHAGMWGGYLSDNEESIRNIMKVLHNRNTLPALSCGMHPGLVDEITNRFGYDYLANCGGSIHGHPDGTKSGAMAMRQAIDRRNGNELTVAIDKWGFAGPTPGWYK